MSSSQTNNSVNIVNPTFPSPVNPHGHPPMNPHGHSYPSSGVTPHPRPLQGGTTGFPQQKNFRSLNGGDIRVYVGLDSSCTNMTADKRIQSISCKVNAGNRRVEGRLTLVLFEENTPGKVHMDLEGSSLLVRGCYEDGTMVDFCVLSPVHITGFEFSTAVDNLVNEATFYFEACLVPLKTDREPEPGTNKLAEPDPEIDDDWAKELSQ